MLTILDFIQNFLVERGFEEGLFERRNKLDHPLEDKVLYYQRWGFACMTKDDRLFLLPFKTNKQVWVNPADPNFFSVVKEAAEFPEPGHPFYPGWDPNGPVAQKSGARDS